MTEPTRDALHAETLAFLERRATKSGDFENASDLMAFRARQYAYATECVQRVPELEAEVERLRARVKRYADHDEGCKSYDRQPCDCGFPEAWYATFPEDAAATREGTDG